jgi:probable HAF family extracellular repeat protein
MLDLGTLGGTFGSPFDLNNEGEVVGASNLRGDVTAHPFLWRGVNSQMQDLGTLGGSFGIAEGINDAGEVVGIATNTNDQALLAFRWKDGAMINLGTVKGYDCSGASHINSKGQIVGGSFSCAIGPDGPSHAFLWQNGVMTDLNFFVPAGSGLTLSDAGFINDQGEIAAAGVLLDGDQRAILLIPCGEGEEGCVDASENADSATVIAPAPKIGGPTKPGIPHTPSAITAAWRARFARPYRIPRFRVPMD